MANQHADQHQGQKQVVVQTHRGQLKAQYLNFFPQVEAEKTDGIDLIDALGSVGDVHGVVKVVEKHPNDFAKTQRHNGQVVTPQAQGGSAQQHAKETGQAGSQWNHDPQRGVNPVRKQRGHHGKALAEVRRGHQTVHVGTNGEKSDVAQIEQAGIADHNIQAQCQQHIQQGHIGNAHPGVAKTLQQQWQQQQTHCCQRHGDQIAVLEFHVGPWFTTPYKAQARSATRSPSRPEGRSVSTMIKTIKAKISE